MKTTWSATPIFLRVLVLLGISLTPPLWGQHCTPEQERACRTDCGPVSDVGQQNYNRCVARCLAECPKNPTCTNATGVVYPKYYILGLVYAPPGCTNTATLKCAAQSSVDYQSGSSMGTKVSTENSFKEGVDAKVDMGITTPFEFFKLTEGGGISGGYSNTSSSTNSISITKGQTLENKATGNGDGVDHSQDAFILLLNPAIAVHVTQSGGNGECGPTVTTWNLGLSGSPVQRRFLVYVEWLKNPASMPANVAQQLQTLKFTNDDYQAILSQDPFAKGSTTIDAKRFTPTTYSFPYEPPLQEAACNNGVCSCMAMSDSIKNQLETVTQTASQTEYTLGFSTNVGFSDILDQSFNVNFSADHKLTWTSTSTDADTTDSTQTATATVVCPSTGYQGPTIMSIYWDNLFGSFLFVPTTLSSPQNMMLSQGTATGASGRPVPHMPVTLTVAGKTYHTWTNNHGDYFFFVPKRAGAQKPAGIGQVSMGGVKHTVTVGSPAKVILRVR